MSLMSKLGKAFMIRRCPAGQFHKINIDNVSCGHTGKVLDWSEEWERWIPNPTKTEVAKEMIVSDDEFAVDREARERLEEAVRDGKIKPTQDIKRMIMNR